MKKTALLGLVILLLCNGCPQVIETPQPPTDLLSGSYRTLGENEFTEDESEFIVLSRAEDGWRVSANDRNEVRDLLEVSSEELAQIFNEEDLPYSQCAADSLSMICVTRPGAKLRDDAFSSFTGSFVIIVDYGVMEVEKFR